MNYKLDEFQGEKRPRTKSPDVYLKYINNSHHFQGFRNMLFPVGMVRWIGGSWSYNKGGGVRGTYDDCWGGFETREDAIKGLFKEYKDDQA